MQTPPGFVPGPPPSETRALEPGFLAYAGPPAVFVSGKRRHVAWLGSINGDKATFCVHCWWEEEGMLEVIVLKDPPTNHSAFFVENGALRLMGVRGNTPDVWEVPGYVAPPAPLTLLDVAMFLIGRLSDASAPLTQAVRRAVGK